MQKRTLLNSQLIKKIHTSLINHSKRVLSEVEPSFCNPEINEEDPNVLDSSLSHPANYLGGEAELVTGKEYAIEEPMNGRKLSVCLPTVFLPKELQVAVRSVLSTYSRKERIQDGKNLTHYLLNRIPVGCEWINTSSKNLQSEGGASNNKALRSAYNPNMVWAIKPSKAVTSDDSRADKATKWAPVLRYHKRESQAFLAGRTQAAYGTALRALTEIAKQDKSYAPATLLDFGSGLGTVEWAAHHLWADSLYEYQCVDISSDMLDMAKSLRLGGSKATDLLESERKEAKECIPGVYSRQYLPLSRQVKHDIVVAAHTLGELSSVSLRRFAVSALWRKTKDYLVLVEPGSWSGYKLIMEVRNLILNASDWTLFEDETAQDLDGHVMAPCPHDLQCPLLQEPSPRRPCHFAQRVQLSEAEKDTHLKKLGCHIEGFTYLIMKKGARDASNGRQARLIEPTRKRSRHFICKMCTTEGKLETTIFTKKKHKEIYREGRKSKWGDLLTLNEPVLT